MSRKTENEKLPPPTAIATEDGLTPEEMERQAAQFKMMTAKLEYEAAVRRSEVELTPESDEDAELKAIRLQTARLDMLIAQERNTEIIETREQRIARRKQALADMEADARTKASIRAACRHRVGGFGLTDAYRGGKENVTSIIESSLPILGMKLFFCTRCYDEAITPDRNLKNPNHAIYNLEEYDRQMVKFLKFEDLMKDSYNAIPMGGPIFAFEKDGLPVHPTIV